MGAGAAVKKAPAPPKPSGSQPSAPAATGSAARDTGILESFKLSDDTVVEFLTDVEGNWEYFMRFVSMSKVLHWEGEEQGAWGPGTLSMHETGLFVFGGDAPDKGPGDIRFVKLLLSLKQRYPSRVHIVLGNRDINKVRFYAELAPGEDGTRFQPPWEPNAKPYKEYLEETKLPLGLLSTLKWMLDCNMGCQKTTFGTRKHELALIHSKASDEDVLGSFRDSVDPTGSDPWMLNLLRVGKLAIVIGDMLFIHAGVHEPALGMVPGKKTACVGLHEWVRTLNAWKDARLDDYAKRPLWRTEGGVRKRGGDELIQYGTLGGGGCPTIVYHNPFTDGNPRAAPPAVERFLADAGIRRVFSGHQPHGQCPTVVRHMDTGLLVFTCDTSYSDMKAEKLFNKANNRGSCVSIVRVQGSKTHVQGVLSCGTPHEFKLSCNPSEDELPDALVGRQLTDGSWVKSVLENGNMVCARGKGFGVTVQKLHPGKVCLMLKDGYSNGDRRFVVQAQTLQAEWLRHCHTTTEQHSETTPTSAEFSRAEFDQADTYIIDCYGVLWGIHDATKQRPPEELEKIVVGKVNELIAAKKRVIFATNNANHTRRRYVDKLLQLGFNVCGDTDDEKTAALRNVVTASYTCAWFLKQAKVSRPFVVCSGLGLLDELKSVGITNYVATIDDEGAIKEEFMKPAKSSNIAEIMNQACDIDMVVVGWDLQFSALKNAIASMYVKRSQSGSSPMQIVTCSRDTSHLVEAASADCLTGGDRQISIVGNGAMAQSICSSVGKYQEAINVGKPSEVLLETLRRPEAEGGFGVDLAKTIIIGDTMETDIELAYRGGMRSLLVLSGVASKPDLSLKENLGKPPTWVLNSLADI